MLGRQGGQEPPHHVGPGGRFAEGREEEAVQRGGGLPAGLVGEARGGPGLAAATEELA